MTAITRRAALGLAGAFAVSRPSRASIDLPDAPSILVAGPAGGRMDRWGAAIAEPLGHQMLGAGALHLEPIGGSDGITGVNQFQVRAAPDGAVSLLLPGMAITNWLAGDSRARFDAGSWAPLWGGRCSALVASRRPLVRGGGIRLAVSSLGGPALAGLLALERMGVRVEPVIMPADAALNRSGIDAVFLRGETLQREFPTLAARHWTPAFTLGLPGPDGNLVRDPAFPTLPTAGERIAAAPAAAELADACRAVAAAATLEVAHVLPIATPAAILAWWRRGCDTLPEAPAVQQIAAQSANRFVPASDLAATFGAITIDVTAQLSLRRFLVERYNWQPA